MRAVEQKADAAAALGLVHVRRREQDGRALLQQIVEDQPEVAARQRVDADGRLVEQQDARLVDQAGGER